MAALDVADGARLAFVQLVTRTAQKVLSGIRALKGQEMTAQGAEAYASASTWLGWNFM
jgi:hypothetical protein